VDEHRMVQGSGPQEGGLPNGGLQAVAMAVEWALAGHPAVAEVVTVQVQSARAASLRAMVVPQAGHAPDEALRAELAEHVRVTVGDNAPLVDVRFVEYLPKTRTGKVMRWMLETPSDT
jgi:acetyl-CoA synthetase